MLLNKKNTIRQFHCKICDVKCTTDVQRSIKQKILRLRRKKYQNLEKNLRIKNHQEYSKASLQLLWGLFLHGYIDHGLSFNAWITAHTNNTVGLLLPYINESLELMYRNPCSTSQPHFNRIRLGTSFLVLQSLLPLFYYSYLIFSIVLYSLLVASKPARPS